MFGQNAQTVKRIAAGHVTLVVHYGQVVTLQRVVHYVPLRT